MTKDIWINLPVKDVQKAKEFYTAIGFTLNTASPGNDNDAFASFFVSEKKVALMLFPEAKIQEFAKAEISDTSKGAEVLISIDAESRAEVDEYAAKAEKAGGTIYGKPGDIQGWMYGCGFTDVDGHRWNALYMDMSKMPKA